MNIFIRNDAPCRSPDRARVLETEFPVPVCLLDAFLLPVCGLLGDLLAFAQIFVADVLECRHVEEDFFPIARDESKALVRKFLDCSLSHVGPPSV